MNRNRGTLYVVATPIGNLGDLSPRAGEVLASVAVIAAEDTRRAGQLLTHLGVSTPVISLHEHNEIARVPELLRRIGDGESVALISDAGTPLISDPGFRLVEAARHAGTDVRPIPGSCAAIALLSVAGLPVDRFRFEGFLPSRAAARRSRLAALATVSETLVFYEAVHRITAMLEDLRSVFGGERPAAVGRELTKLHETIYRGTLDEVLDAVGSDPGGDRGEFTVVVGGDPAVPEVGEAELARIVGILAADLPPSQAAMLAARITGAPRKAAYGLAVASPARPTQDGDPDPDSER